MIATDDGNVTAFKQVSLVVDKMQSRMVCIVRIREGAFIAIPYRNIGHRVRKMTLTLAFK
jgi:hypothetical protein